MYVDYEYYKSLYGEDAMQESQFNRYSWNACKKLDAFTTGVDGVKKLQVAFPVYEENAEAVKRCACEIVELMKKISDAEKHINGSKGYVERSDGILQGKVITTVSSGSESISYSSGNSSNATLIDKVLADKTAQEKMYKDTVKEYLHGVSDANGVNLLYMGPYPYRTE